MRFSARSNVVHWLKKNSKKEKINYSEFFGNYVLKLRHSPECSGDLFMVLKIFESHLSTKRSLSSLPKNLDLFFSRSLDDKFVSEFFSQLLAFK